MKIAVFGKQCHHNDCQVIKCVFDSLLRHGCEVWADESFFRQIADDVLGEHYAEIKMITDADFTADMALSIGGDGTFLHTAARIADRGIPILGINIGRLGFLTDLSYNDVEAGLEAIYNGDYHIEERSVLQVECDGITHRIWPYALNEVAILKQDTASMISIRTAINGEFFNTYQADGLVIATPTGSTAYALSVGGPILVPQAANWVLAPVAPHSITVRPLVVNDDVSITLEVTGRTDNFLLSCDGRSILLHTGKRIALHKAPFTIKIVKGNNHSFSQTLRTKLMWGVDKRDGQE